MKIKVYLNKRMMAMADGFKPEDIDMENVYNIEPRPYMERDNDKWTDAEILEWVFTLLNIDHPADYKRRSLSTGDIVGLDGRYYACQPLGWARIEEFVPKETP